MGNQNLYIEEEQTTQWPKEKVQKDKQRSTKLTYKTKDRVTRTPLKTRGELRCYGRVSSSCSNIDTRRVYLVTNPVSSVYNYQSSNKKQICKTGPFLITCSPFHISVRYRFTMSTIDIVFKASEMTLLYESIFTIHRCREENKINLSMNDSKWKYRLHVIII